MQSGATDALVLREQRRFGWRVAFVLTLGFVVAELAAWPLAFIVPLLAVQFLAVLPGAPTGRQMLVVVLVTLATTSLAVFASELLHDRPAAYLAVLFALFALAFYLDNFPKTKLIATLLLLSNAILPILGMQDSVASAGMRDTLIYGSLVGLLLAWLAHALFPSVREPRAPPGTPAPAPTPMGGEWLRAAILLLPVAFFLAQPDEASFPFVVAVLTILRQVELGMSRRLAVGLLVGNVIGGVAASIGYAVLSVFPEFATLCLVLLAAGFFFGGRIALAGPKAPVYVIGLIVFITLLGLGLIEFTSGSAEQFAQRFVGVLKGALYALAALVLFTGRRRGQVTSAAGRGRA
jgi:hypothetical protein